MKRWLPVVFVSGCLAPDGDVGVSSQDSLVKDPQGFGASPILTPCWANPAPATAPYRAMVEMALRAEYHEKSRLRVPAGSFPSCPEMQGWGADGPTATFPDFSNAVALYEATNGSPMLLDGFRANAKGSMGGYIVFNTGATTPEDSAAVHELGHIVGLVHEQNRPGSICREQWQPEQVVASNMQAIGPYDPASVMSYCVDPATGKLSHGDVFALKALHGSAGSFVEQGGFVWRHHWGEKCIVTTPQQLDAFGGTQLLIDGVLPTDNLGATSVGACRWPDGFYQSTRDGKVLFAIGGEVEQPIGGSGKTLPYNAQASMCWIDSPEKLSVFGGDGRVMTVNASSTEIGRLRTGGASTPCPWPDGYYRFPGSTTVYMLDGPSWCTVSSSQEYDFLQVGGQTWMIPATPSLFVGRTAIGQCSPSTFQVKNELLSGFPLMAGDPDARMVSGDFNGDQRADVLLFGTPTLTKVVIALSNGNGTFSVSVADDASFIAHATEPGVKVVVGRFDSDGRDDVAMVGVDGWTTIPVFHSNGDGSFYSTNQSAEPFARAALDPNVQVISGDFDGNGQDDIAMTGVVGWTTIPVALGSGNGSFTVYNPSSSLFATTSTEVGAQAVAGDFDGDGVDDIALTGVAGWTTIPVAYGTLTTSSAPAPSFTVSNPSAATFAKTVAEPGVKFVAGKFNDDDKEDIAAIGAVGWRSIPIAFGADRTQFEYENSFLPDFPIYGADADAWFLAGDHDQDGDTDLMLTGVVGWNTLPVAVRFDP
jgi:hypothetical protein